MKLKTKNKNFKKCTATMVEIVIVTRGKNEGE